MTNADSRILRASAGVSAKRAWPYKRAAIVALVVLGLAVIGWSVLVNARSALHRTLTVQMETVLDANVNALDVWLRGEQIHLETIALSKDLRRSVAALTKVTDEKLSASPHQASLRDLAALLHPIQGHLGYLVVDRNGRIVGASEDEALGLRLSDTGMAIVGRALDGTTYMSRPYRPDGMVQGAWRGPRAPRIIGVTPIRVGDEVVAAFGLRIDPKKQFSSILKVGRVGETGQSYAFDRNGFVLSVLRDKANAILNERLDTRMIEAVGAGQAEGVVVEPFMDHRGVEVIGAWKWDKESEVGLGTQVDAAEAFAPLKPLETTLAILFGLLVVAAAGGVIAYFFAVRLRKRVQQLGQYTLERKIGEGGMGAVYKASHSMLRRPTAVKLLRGEAMSDEAIRRFEREVQLTSELSHPSTIAVYDYGRTPGGVFYYAMEYLEGITLAQLIALEGTVDPSRVVHVLKQVCGSLAEAHEAGLLHRDIKPPNVMLCVRGGMHDVAKVLDFGLVKEMNEATQLALTMQGQVTGTPAYIAPERLQGSREPDPRIDLYALGAVGFNLITGQDLFQSTDFVEVAFHAVNTDVDRPSARLGRALPEGLDQLILDCLAKDPGKRPASARAMLARLEDMELAGRWHEEDARRWWDENVDRIADVRGGKPVAAPAASEDTADFETDSRRF